MWMDPELISLPMELLLQALAGGLSCILGFELGRWFVGEEMRHWLRARRAQLVLARYRPWQGLGLVAYLVFITVFGERLGPAQAVAMGFFAGTLSLAAMIDLRSRLLPDRLTGGLMVLGLCLAVANITVGLTEAVAGGVVGYLLPWALARFTDRRRRSRLPANASMEPSMGRGDFALLAAIGCWLGFSSLAFVLAFASVGMLSLAVWGSLRRGWRLSTALPFGPALCLAAMAVAPFAPMAAGPNL